jgi:biopolymer transport protein ExbD
MLKRPKRRVGVKIDMTPMVDVAFLLLIFYMTTTTFKPPEKKQITVPSSHSQIDLPDVDILNISVTKDDSIFLEYIVKSEKEVKGKKEGVLDRVYEEANPQTLGEIINRIRATQWGYKMRLVIKADRDVRYGTMAAIMEALQQMDIIQFHLVTELDNSPIT